MHQVLLALPKPASYLIAPAAGNKAAAGALSQTTALQREAKLQVYMSNAAVTKHESLGHHENITTSAREEFWAAAPAAEPMAATPFVPIPV